MDILQPLPVDQWNTVQDSLKVDWPKHAHYYNWIKTATKWKKKHPDLAIEICCPDGKYDSGTFIGISQITVQCLVIFAFEKSAKDLERSLSSTNLINWKKRLIFYFVNEDTKDILNRVLKEKQKSLEFQFTAGMCKTYFKPKEESALVDVEVPKGYILKPLTEENIPLVVSIWPHRDQNDIEGTEKYLGFSIKMNSSVGLFDEHNNLVSWILHGDFGSLQALQTVEKFKRKGFARIVLKKLIKILAVEENMDSTLFIVDGNTPSENLFKSIDFQPINNVYFFEIIPKKIFK